MKRTQTWILALASSVVCTVAMAGPTCTTVSKDKWQDPVKFKAQLTQQGYTMEKFKETSGSCYEIYGKNKEGKTVEIYFNPVDGKAVKSEVRS